MEYMYLKKKKKKKKSVVFKISHVFFWGIARFYALGNTKSHTRSVEPYFIYNLTCILYFAIFYY
jgi:hypothetical protein